MQPLWKGKIILTYGRLGHLLWLLQQERKAPGYRLRKTHHMQLAAMFEEENNSCLIEIGR